MATRGGSNWTLNPMTTRYEFFSFTDCVVRQLDRLCVLAPQAAKESTVESILGLEVEVRMLAALTFPYCSGEYREKEKQIKEELNKLRASLKAPNTRVAFAVLLTEWISWQVLQFARMGILPAEKISNDYAGAESYGEQFATDSPD